jgi:hypothetical protein
MFKGAVAIGITPCRYDPSYEPFGAFELAGDPAFGEAYRELKFRQSREPCPLPRAEDFMLDRVFVGREHEDECPLA